MRKVTTFVAIAAIAGQLAAPAFAYDTSTFNPTTMLGTVHVSGAAAMGYFRLPLGQTSGKSDAPRFGLMVAGPQPYTAGEVPLALNAPRLIDLSFTGRDMSQPWTASSWHGALAVGNKTAWVSDRKDLPAGEHMLLESGTSWVAVGLISAGIVVGAFALTNRSK